MRAIRIFLIMCLASRAAADGEEARFALGRDAYLAGQTVTLDMLDRDDAFLAGESVTLAAPIAGSAHMAGRWISVEADVGGDLYAAGQRVAIDAGIAGDATLMGQAISLGAPVGRNLRVLGSTIRIERDIGGSLLVGGEFVDLDASIGGDMAVAARAIDFGNDARVDGTLILYEQEGDRIEVPAGVAPIERIDRRTIEEWDADWQPMGRFSARAAVGGFLMAVLWVTVAAALLAALAPAWMADKRSMILAAPLRAVAAGFLALSALSGAGLVLALTVVGVLLTPAAVFLALATGFVGYIVGAYAFGVGLLGTTGRHAPETTGDRALAAAVGALAAGLLGLIPFLGWLVVLGLSLAGAGAVTMALVLPRLPREI
jgi:hypothetical protein